MAEPTPEERIQAAHDECDKIIRAAKAEERNDEIRAAVAAETERCAKVFPEEVECPACFVKPQESCKSIGGRENGDATHPHSGRHTAAIRRAPEPSADEENDG